MSFKEAPRFAKPSVPEKAPIRREEPGVNPNPERYIPQPKTEPVPASPSQPLIPMPVGGK